MRRLAVISIIINLLDNCYSVTASFSVCSIICGLGSSPVSRASSVGTT